MYKSCYICKNIKNMMIWRQAWAWSFLPDFVYFTYLKAVTVSNSVLECLFCWLFFFFLPDTRSSQPHSHTPPHQIPSAKLRVQHPGEGKDHKLGPGAFPAGSGPFVTPLSQQSLCGTSRIWSTSLSVLDTSAATLRMTFPVWIFLFI